MTDQNNAGQTTEKAIRAAITLLDGDLDHENAEAMRSLLSKLRAEGVQAREPVADERKYDTAEDGGKVERQYHYRMPNCTPGRCKCREGNGYPECPCWHDVGTGPLKGKEATATHWRDKPSAPVAGEAFGDFADQYLTDGNGYAPVSTFKACGEAFNKEWPNREAAFTAAKAEYDRLHPSVHAAPHTQADKVGGDCTKGGAEAELPDIEPEPRTATDYPVALGGYSTHVADDRHSCASCGDPRSKSDCTPVFGEAMQLAESLRDWHGKSDGITTAIPDELAQALYGYLYDAAEAPIRALIAKHAELLEGSDYAYFELARTRATGWMAWLCSHPAETHPDRKVLARGQGSTPDEACRLALADFDRRAKGE
ncbi:MULTISPECIES: hypothetical protein [Achromobacter]|uniref:hypothetical protein n=1 Tax=Achromobacter TaxID=222 RepID=UPI0023F8559E|nr:hypothetical protein [Achromobacter anxifer]MDF8363320.1 hypothetical protein [Achromobacter anxifer]